MDSLEERLNSFKSWKDNKRLTKINFAVCGFSLSCIASQSTECYFCNKPLTGWEEDDDPYLEHLGHSPKCPLLNLNIKKNRILTFSISNDNNVDVATKNFFMYNIKSGIKTIFCYICGYSTSVNSQDLNHDCKKDKELFYVKLLKGEYNEKLLTFLNQEIILSKDTKNIINNFISNYKYNKLLSVKDYVLLCIEEELKTFDKEMESYKKMSLDLVEDLNKEEI